MCAVEFWHKVKQVKLASSLTNSRISLTKTEPMRTFGLCQISPHINSCSFQCVTDCAQHPHTHTHHHHSISFWQGTLTHLIAPIMSVNLLFFCTTKMFCEAANKGDYKFSSTFSRHLTHTQTVINALIIFPRIHFLFNPICPFPSSNGVLDEYMTLNIFWYKPTFGCIKFFFFANICDRGHALKCVPRYRFFLVIFNTEPTTINKKYVQLYFFATFHYQHYFFCHF